ATTEVEILNLMGTNNINGFGNALANTITGNLANNTLDGGAGVDTLVGGAGNDTYVTDNPADLLSELAGEGNDTVIAGYSYTAATDFENVTLSGTGDFNATGNAVANTLIGNSGNNTLDGLAGADSMEGGAGNDYFIVDNSGDIATDNGGGFDEVFASASFTLGNGIENLTLDTLVSGGIDGTGNNLDNVITGTDGDNILMGLGGNDTLYAYLDNDTLDGGTGADSMFGGQGDDTYYVDNAGDQVFENFGEGNDTVYSSVTFTLTGSNVENLILTGTANLSATGTGDNDNITGNSGNNTLTGLGGNDTLNGGTGTDKLIGGLGDDTYIVDSQTDIISENAGEGTDTVQATGPYTLGNNLENLELFANGLAKGNTLDNTITHYGTGTIDGAAGADLMIHSGAGAVTFLVDNLGDSVDGSAIGTDTVVSSVSFDMDVRGDGDVDNLTLTGSGLLNGFGNAANNTITGNSGANTLDGRGGDDHLNGGGGNDTFFVDSTGDVLSDTAGVDTVNSGVNWTLGTGFEKLNLLTGAGNIDGFGNAAANVITGNDGSNSLVGAAGNDTLSGGIGSDFLEGGLGADRLTGGLDSDTFYWGAVNQGADTITDFQAGVGGDALDFSDILVGYNGNVSEFIQITQSGANTIVKVDVNGLAGPGGFVTYATLTGVTLNTDETIVLGQGNLIVT
ncbi:MAG: type I secretion C-terminal target domain-containing protein, partial [Alphaproteobacteria bacterium]|nr:type I secretion C-terminal target domain-containing protein [Alphaproteobacteria bacterium]